MRRHGWRHGYWLMILTLLALLAKSVPTPLYGQNRLPLAREEGMERMAEILGALHYLDNLCLGTSDEWRGFMDRLILAESLATLERTRLIAVFNGAYRTFAEHHHQCTQAALDITQIYRQEGEVLARELVNRYGD